MDKGIGLFFNTNNNETVNIAKYIVEKFYKYKVMVCTEDSTIADLVDIPLFSRKEFKSNIRLMLVIGGDGTFLKAANIVHEALVPILGINRGHLGFLSELEVEEFESNLERIIRGKYDIEKRMTIRGEIYRDNQRIGSAIALNDISINRHPVENTLHFEAYLQDQYIDSYIGDGMVVATPTGSTAYSFSAGGPLIYPGTNCLIVNPICAHILGTSPLIIPADGTINILMKRCEEDAYFVADGRKAIRIQQGDRIQISQSEHFVQMVQLKDHQFFETVRHKLLNRNYRKLD